MVVVEAELERAENRIDQLSLENSRYTEEVRTLSNDLKSFEASDEQFADRESQVSFNLTLKHYPTIGCFFDVSKTFCDTIR